MRRCRQVHALETQRLRLRMWQEQDRAAYCAMNADPQVMRFFPAPQTEEQANVNFDLTCAHFDDHGWGNWAVELNKSGDFLGFIGLSIPRRTLPFTPCVEVGWRLLPAHWGQGYATEGAQAALRFGFDELELNEIVSYTALVNAPSRAVMARLGMHNACEDFAHPALHPGSHLSPHCLYRLSRQLWQETATRT